MRQLNGRHLFALALLILMLTSASVAGAVALRRDFIDIQTAALVFRATLAFLIVAIVVLGVLLKRWHMGSRWVAATLGVFLLSALTFSLGAFARRAT